MTGAHFAPAASRAAAGWRWEDWAPSPRYGADTRQRHWMFCAHVNNNWLEKTNKKNRNGKAIKARRQPCQGAQVRYSKLEQ